MLMMYVHYHSSFQDWTAICGFGISSHDNFCLRYIAYLLISTFFELNGEMTIYNPNYQNQLNGIGEGQVTNNFFHVFSLYKRLITSLILNVLCRFS